MTTFQIHSSYLPYIVCIRTAKSILRENFQKKNQSISGRLYCESSFLRKNDLVSWLSEPLIQRVLRSIKYMCLLMGRNGYSDGDNIVDRDWCMIFVTSKWRSYFGDNTIPEHKLSPISVWLDIRVQRLMWINIGGTNYCCNVSHSRE